MEYSESIKSTLLTAVHELSTEGIAILDKNGKYIYLNPRHAAMYGYKADELMGESWEVLYSEENLLYISENVMPQLVEYGNWEQTLVGKRKDGKNIQTRVSLTLIDDGMFCICEDITEKSRAKEREKHDFIQKIISVTSKK
jgi:PAS domain S-box-containing protein